MFILSPLRKKPIALLWGGQVLSAVGDEVYKMAMVWLAIGLVGYNAGFLAAVEAASVLVFGLFGGVLADKWDYRRTMVGVDLLRGVALLFVPIIAHYTHLTLWLLIAIAIVVSSLSAFFDPSLQAMVPELANDAEELQATNGLLESTRRIARILGPSLVGVLNGLFPLVHFLTVDALSFGLSALSVSAVNRLSHPRAPSDESTENTHPIESLLAGWRIVSRDRILSFCMVVACTTWALWSLAFSLGFALLVNARWPHQIGAYGALAASYGVGNLVSNLCLGSLPNRNPERTMFSGVVLLGLGFIAIAAARTLPLMMLAAAIAAIGGPMDDLSFLALLQRNYKGRDVARVFRLRMGVAYGGILVCFLVSPLLFRLLAISKVIALCGAGIAMVGTGGLVRFIPSSSPPRVGESPRDSSAA